MCVCAHACVRTRACACIVERVLVAVRASVIDCRGGGGGVGGVEGGDHER